MMVGPFRHGPLQNHIRSQNDFLLHVDAHNNLHEGVTTACGTRLTWTCGAELDATELSVQEREVGFVFQSYALFKHMTVADNISFGPRMQHLPIDIPARVQELLDLVELSDLGTR